MVEVTLMFDNGDDGIRHPIGFVVEGHAGSGEYGKDIVCAAVSAVAQAALLGIMDLSEDEVSYEKRPGFMAVTVDLKIARRQDVSAILRTFELAVRAIS